jgi:hypothetical protein
MRGLEIAVPSNETTAHTKPNWQTCQAGKLLVGNAKLKLKLRLAMPPCFISSQFAEVALAEVLLNKRYWSGLTA